MKTKNGHETNPPPKFTGNVQLTHRQTQSASARSFLFPRILHIKSLSYSVHPLIPAPPQVIVLMAFTQMSPLPKTIIHSPLSMQGKTSICSLQTIAFDLVFFWIFSIILTDALQL